MIVTSSSLFSVVRYYLRKRQELLRYLSKHPDDWSKFQKTFNLTLDNLYQDIINFERENINKHELKVYKLKKIFEERYRRYFLYGEFIRWSFEKPFEYAGDFKIIDGIYKNQPRTTGFDRLWDNYFQQLSISTAVRERKEDLKKFILDFVKRNKDRDIRIMNLAAGPTREIKELIEADSEELFSKVIFDCYDFDSRAIEYARQLLNNHKNINFFQKNAIRLAFKKDIKEEIQEDYDLIYSIGLFDYLDERVATRLAGNLKKLLKKNGVMIISNVRDKYSNSSAGWMEWVADWYLVYRTQTEFKELFLNAGFSSEDLKILSQQSKIMQYCFARAT